VTTPLRVIQWATGGVGRAAIEGIVRHPDLTLVGCWVHSPDKDGLDVGDIVGLPPLGVRATTSKEDVLALDADAVVYAPVVPDPGDVEALLRSGKNVVTPTGWFHPPESPTTARLRAACTDAGVSLHGTGIDPGGVTDLHLLFFSRHSSAVTFLRGEEFSDIRTYDAPEVIRGFMGFGGTPEEAAEGPMLAMLDGGFRQSLQLVLDGLGFGEASIRALQEVAVAAAPIAPTPIGTIEPGQVAARRFAWEAVVGDRVVARVAVNWLMGETDLDPAWTFGPEGPRFEVEVRGDPDVSVVIHGWHPATVEAGLRRNPGVVTTAMHCVNSVPYVCAAPPGIRTYLDLPMVLGRAHPDLADRADSRSEA
jgi:hypothetical protein